MLNLKTWISLIFLPYNPLITKLQDMLPLICFTTLPLWAFTDYNLCNSNISVFVCFNSFYGISFSMQQLIILRSTLIATRLITQSAGQCIIIYHSWFHCTKNVSISWRLQFHVFLITTIILLLFQRKEKEENTSSIYLTY